MNKDPEYSTQTLCKITSTLGVNYYPVVSYQQVAGFNTTLLKSE